MPSEIACDLVLLTWNKPELLKGCLDRLFRHTDLSCRLILVDNASTDPEAVRFLEHLKSPPHILLEIVRRARNDGFSKGINDGLSRASAPWICILNNDIQVTEGWLSEMLHVAKANRNLGLINPMSNELSLHPTARETVDDVAKRLRLHRGRWTENWGCVGFCILLSRQVFERVGGLDEEFQFIYFEDADYSLRVRQAGWDCGIAEGAYVYHLGSATMNQNSEKSSLFQENQKRFLRKWGRESPQRIAYLLPAPPPSLPPETIRQRIRYLANEDHSITVFCTEATRALVPTHYQVIPQTLPKNLFALLALIRITCKKKKFHRIVRVSETEKP